MPHLAASCAALSLLKQVIVRAVMSSSVYQAQVRFGLATWPTSWKVNWVCAACSVRHKGCVRCASEHSIS